MMPRLHLTGLSTTIFRSDREYKMNAPVSPFAKTLSTLSTTELIGILASQGKWIEAYRCALQLRDIFGYEEVDVVWREYYGRGLNDDE